MAIKQAKAEGRCVVGKPTRLFPQPNLITFRMLKTLQLYVEDLEVAKNAYWEWEDAIFYGSEMFFLLSEEKQGTVRVDLNKRQLTFSPLVSPGIKGIMVGLGMGSASVELTGREGDILSAPELAWACDRSRLAETIAAKRAVLSALQLDATSPDLLGKIEIRLNGPHVYVKTSAEVLNRAWQLHAIDYNAAFVNSSGQIICTASAIADVHDVSNP